MAEELTQSEIVVLKLIMSDLGMKWLRKYSVKGILFLQFYEVTTSLRHCAIVITF